MKDNKLYKILAIILFVIFTFLLIFLGILIIGPNRSNNPFAIAILYFINIVIILPLTLYFFGK